MKYKYGQILTLKHDVEVERALSYEKVIIPKGNKVIVGFDKFAHHIRTGMLQPFPEGTEFEKYDAEGIAEYLMICLKSHFPIDEFLDDYEIDENDLKNEIVYALDEIGM